MTIIRRPRREHYLMLDQATVDDMSITLEAKGLLVYLLGRPDNWNVSPAHLRKVTGVGRDKLYRILSELISGGYCDRTVTRDPKTQQIKHYNYEIYEENQTSEPLPEKPYTEKPDTANQDINYKGLITNTEKNKTLAQLAVVRDQQLVHFDAFWAIWPRRVGKIAAEKRWNKIKPTSTIMEKIKANIKAHDKVGDWGARYKFCPFPAKYLNEKLWDDEVINRDEPATTTSFGANGI